MKHNDIDYSIAGYSILEDFATGIIDILRIFDPAQIVSKSVRNEELTEDREITSTEERTVQ
ncbi:MAG: hypothetical protein OEY09_11995 [Gammaproteobacteria bacterium]|nr:hypothetical protein [Gammaproteobacteria bacterium]